MSSDERPSTTITSVTHSGSRHIAYGRLRDSLSVGMTTVTFGFADRRERSSQRVSCMCRFDRYRLVKTDSIAFRRRIVSPHWAPEPLIEQGRC